MEQFKLGIIGYGVVGQALAHGFKDDHVLYYDKFKDSNASLEDVVHKSDYIFVCLPTPMYHDESGIDLSIMDETIPQIAALTSDTEKVIIIKSTVVPGTTRRYQRLYPASHFVFNPEFLTESNFVEDFLHPDRTILGGHDSETLDRVASLYQTRFPDVPLYKTDSTVAELAKYMTNCYLALKVGFANQMKDLSEALGVEYQHAKKLLVADRRIEDDHVDVTEERGFGGKCFPKDMISLIGLAQDLGVDLSILKTTWEYNKKVCKNHDWKSIPFATSEVKPAEPYPRIVMNKKKTYLP